MPRVQITLNDGSNKIVEVDNGFTDNDIDEIAANLNAQLKPKAQPKPKPQPQRPQNTITQKPQANKKQVAFNPQYADILSDNSLTKEQKAEQIKQRGEKERADIQKENIKNKARIGAGGVVTAASGLPIFNIPYVGTGIGGALFDVGQGIMEGDKLPDLAKRAGQGFVVGETIGAIPYVGKYAAKTKAGQAVVKRVAGSKVAQATGKAIEKAANSKIGQELTKERQLRPTPSTVQNENIVTPAVNNTVETPLQETVNEVKSIVPESLKPTRNIDMPDTIYNEKTAKQAQKGIQKEIGDMIEKPSGLVYVNRRYKNRFFKQDVSDSIHPGIRAKHEGDIEINKILKEIKDNPEIINNPEKLAELESRIPEYSGDLKDLTEEYYNKFYQAVDKAAKYDKVTQDLNLSNAAREAGEIKTSRLADTADEPAEIANISKKLKEKGVLPEYAVLHNAEIKQQADEAIKNNFSNTYAGLLGKAQNKQSELSALDFETARQTISRLYQEGRTAEALELTEQISKKATQAGQAVQALSLWHKTTKEGAVQQAQKIIAEYNKTHKKKLPPLSEEQIAKIDELTKNIQKTEPGTRENLVATKLLMKYQNELVPASAGSKLRTLQNINLLLNPKTFLRNITGNAIFSGMENIASKPLAAGIDKIIGLKTKQQTRVLPRLNEYLKGMGQGFKEGVEDVRMGINTRDDIGQRFNLNDRRSFTGVPVLEQLEKALNYSLQVPDRMFYQATLNESLANQMRAAGVDKPTSQMIKQATEEALESVYQNKGVLGNAVLKARQAGNEFGNINGYGFGDALIPYAQTPANVVQQGINYSPLGLIKGSVNLAKGNQRQASLDFARALVGSGLMGGGYAAAKNGLINPAIEDYKAKNNYQTLGIRPNTINVGDSNVSFNQLQPLSAPLTAGANIVDLQNGNTMNAIDRTLDSIADLSMLQSYNKFVKDMSEYGKGTAVLNLAGSIPSRFTTPTYLKQINTYFDPYLRETYDPNPLIQAGNNIISGIPGISQNLPLKYDVTGQPIAKYGTEGNGIENALNTFVNPVFANQKKDDATMQKLIDLYEQTGDKSVLLPMAAKQINFKDLQGNKVKRKLTGREVSQYQQQLGVVNKQLLDGIMNTGIYEMLDDEDKTKLINDTQRYVKNMVDEQLFDKPNAQKRNIIRKLTKTKQDEVINKLLKTYKNKVLPVKANEIYNREFSQSQ